MNKDPKSRAKILLVVGLIALAAGAYFYFTNDSAAIDKANIEIAQYATNAEDAARQIAANNRGDIGSNALTMFLLGFGGVLTLFSIIILLKKPEQKS